jgi:hypothetical protein
MEEIVIMEIFRKHLLYGGRMISGSKSGYRERHPDNDVIFNARIFTPKLLCAWWGDLDITLDNKALQEVCNELGEEMIVTTESVSWYAEDKKYKDIEKYAHAKFIPTSKVYYSRVYDGMEGIKAGNMTIITSKGIDWIEKTLNEK